MKKYDGARVERKRDGLDFFLRTAFGILTHVTRSRVPRNLAQPTQRQETLAYILERFESNYEDTASIIIEHQNLHTDQVHIADNARFNNWHLDAYSRSN